MMIIIIVEGTYKLILQAQGLPQHPDSLVNITNERHVSLSHHLSVRHRMVALALTQLMQKTRGAKVNLSALYNCFMICAAHY